LRGGFDSGADEVAHDECDTCFLRSKLGGESGTCGIAIFQTYLVGDKSRTDGTDSSTGSEKSSDGTLSSGANTVVTSRTDLSETSLISRHVELFV
jgi:hypothetical protein